MPLWFHRGSSRLHFHEAYGRSDHTVSEIHLYTSAQSPVCIDSKSCHKKHFRVLRPSDHRMDMPDWTDFSHGSEDHVLPLPASSALQILYFSYVGMSAQIVSLMLPGLQSAVLHSVQIPASGNPYDSGNSRYPALPVPVSWHNPVFLSEAVQISSHFPGFLLLILSSADWVLQFCFLHEALAVPSPADPVSRKMPAVLRLPRPDAESDLCFGSAAQIPGLLSGFAASADLAILLHSASEPHLPFHEALP